ncbi:MAG TPA: hypothetical protein PL076_02290 [Bacillota bacterium]|nr:hypothetical protein [Bacillota bacterium]HQJ36713.1 hypothetical protein [Bacillota bacterium]
MFYGRIKRFLKILLSAMLVLSMISGCSASKTTTPTGKTPGSLNVEFTEETTVPSGLKLPDLGAASFTVDTGNKVSGAVPLAGDALTLELTDNAGLHWTLKVPAGAVKWPETITMTALTDVRSSDIPGKLAGVMLEPDGLRFDAPAQLTVSGSAPGGSAIFLSGNANGSSVTFAMPGDKPNSTLVTHFSTLLLNWGDEDPDFEAIRERGVEMYKTLAQMAREMLKEKIKLPVPPSLSPHCVGQAEKEANSKKLAEFENAFNNPEMPLLEYMLSIRTQLQLSGSSYIDSAAENGLMQRMVSKADALISKYGDDAEKLTAIASAVMKTAYNASFEGGAENDAAPLLTKLGELYVKAIDKFFLKLTKEHDYRYVEAIVDALRVAHLLGAGEHISYEELAERLEKALHFDVKITYTCQIVTAKNILEASFPIESNTLGQQLELKGSGTGSLIYYLDSGDERITADAPDFTVQLSVTDFMPCEGTAAITLDGFTPEYETYYNEKGIPMLKFPVLRGNWSNLFYDYRRFDPVSESGFYKFPVALNVGKAYAVEETIQVSDGEGGTGNLEFRLEHTPQE